MACQGPARWNYLSSCASPLSMDAAGYVTLQGVKLAIQGTGHDSHVGVGAKLIDLN